jgi:hypothetical protein
MPLKSKASAKIEDIFHLFLSQVSRRPQRSACVYGIEISHVLVIDQAQYSKNMRNAISRVGYLLQETLSSHESMTATRLSNHRQGAGDEATTGRENRRRLCPKTTK